MELTGPAVLRRLTAGGRAGDAVTVLVCLALTALAVKTPWSPLPRPVVAAAGVLGSLALLSRRRWPFAVTVAGAAAFAFGGNLGPLLVALYSATANARRRHVWAHAVAGCAGIVGWTWFDARRVTGDDVVYAALGVALVVAVGVHMATRGALLVSLRERADRVEAERRLRDEQARAAERTRIAREMHDVLAHKVSLIALYAGALELHADGDQRLKEGTALIRVTAREALQELRTVLGVLRTGPAEPELFADLGSLVRASTQAGQRVELHDEAGELPPAAARVVHRVVQEGLTNARKHAPDAPATVSLHRDGAGNVAVTVHNGAGTGTPLDLPGSNAGLVGLAERIRLAGGTLRSGPVDRDGWELHAVVPCVVEAP